ncbi:IS110 family transposase [Chryseobacterium sp. APV1]|uniref:IS110 family transposase n=1 Tax=Chryseobacterium urinae TaxID=3058400 RepID=A0ABT8U4L1_9FLAO|nr:IS110 family transposase [Chryseobacterium sp. APV1]MDO3426011.1 IS110 family transposase [Chryseobacterium sp. APV1]
MQTAINFIIITDNFKNFENAKHLACYAGVVPFKNQSGTIVKKERISKMANQKLKKLLHLSAMATIRSDKELKAYFVRKVEQGKNKMSVLNAIRNKLVHRIMAVIKRQQPYLSKEEFLSTKNSDFTCLLT